MYKYDIYARELSRKPIKEITSLIRKTLADIEYYKSELPKKVNFLKNCLTKTEDYQMIYNSCFSYEYIYTSIIHANMTIQSCKNAIKIKKDLKSRSVDK